MQAALTLDPPAQELHDKASSWVRGTLEGSSDRQPYHVEQRVVQHVQVGIR